MSYCTEVSSPPLNAFAISTARSALTGASTSPVSAKIVRGRPPAIARYTGRPPSVLMVSRVASGATEPGSTPRADTSSGDKRAVLSIGSRTGMRAYIITMPDANQTKTSTPPAIPSQRCE